jgi:hypothetical protein
MSYQMTTTSLLASWLPQQLQLGLSSAAMRRATVKMAATRQSLLQLGSPGGPKLIKTARKRVPKESARVAAAARIEAARAHGQHAGVLGCAGTCHRQRQQSAAAQHHFVQWDLCTCPALIAETP